MKKTLLYLLIFTYSASIFKPVMPYLSDAIDHTFYYAEHVKTVHFENGKYHVHNELVKHSRSSTNDDKDAMQKKMASSNEHLITTIYSTPSFSTYLSHNYFRHIQSSTFDIYINGDFPPPRYS